MPNIRLAHPELSPNAAAAAAKVSPEIRELIKRSGKNFEDLWNLIQEEKNDP